ncbi:hypothetical protein HYS95_00085 [Candidatus Daviesbacteria bacterium]|nr:hypothetical protein [Candidatus Daviesbacteria bacterium]
MKAFFGWGLIIAFFIFIFNSGSSNESSSFNDSNYFSDDQNAISRTDAIDSHWDSISDYVDGTETIEACSDDSGNCYSLDADISNGHLETLYFPNGGYLNFYTEFDSDGDAYDTDSEGNSWSFTLDMDSSIVDDAISNWASDNDYTID